jgi:tetratricopeptide (TPR) repeat protein
VTAEYAYAQAYAGAPEAALYNIDRALITEPLDSEVRFYLSEMLNAFGLNDASDELSAPVPAWLKSPLKLPVLDISAPEGDFEQASASINILMAQKRYARSAVLFDLLCGLADNARCYAGYAIALERLGAYKAAAAQAKKSLELAQTSERKYVAAAYIAVLEQRPPLKYSAALPEKPFKGRWLAFLGGSLDRADNNTAYAFSGRAGKFISERLDIAANAALNGGNPVSDYNGPTIGVSARYNEPLSFAPLNGTMALKIERIPSPDKDLAFIISPGLSYFLKDSSIDLFWDLALAGTYSGSVTMSLGYTIYFGGGK